jgi:membrane-associated phospholipid phosphatase
MFDLLSLQTITRLGEAQILLPAALLGMVSAGRSGWPAAWRWMVLIGAAGGLTLLSKLAFIGWGLGWAWADFTGVSGHTLFASAVLPPLALLLTMGRTRAARSALVMLAIAMAAAVGVSRVLLGAHSVSEVVAGWVLGGGAAALAWSALSQLVRRPDRPAHSWAALAVLLWGVLAVGQAAPSRSHERVTAMALHLSGRSVPYQRADLHRDAAAQQVPQLGLQTGGRLSQVRVVRP